MYIYYVDVFNSSELNYIGNICSSSSRICIKSRIIFMICLLVHTYIAFNIVGTLLVTYAHIIAYLCQEMIKHIKILDQLLP